MTFRLARAAVAVILAASTSVHGSESRTPAQEEQQEIFRAMRPTAEACEGSATCFGAYARPFGRLVVTLGASVARNDPKFASQVTNFAFGVAGGQARVDPAAMAGAFHCGPPCAIRRKQELLSALPTLREAVREFQAADLDVVARWPEQAVRVNDSVVQGDLSFRVDRTPVLRAWQGWLPFENAISRKLETSDNAGLHVAALLSSTAATSIAKDVTGGIRVIHRESIGDNEAGLLFLDDAHAMRVDPSRQADGGQYTFLERIASGVYFYVRT